MPLYDYVCRACDERFEVLAAFADPAPPCPACAAKGAERRLTGFQLGGRGRPRSELASVPFESARCCGGGACRHR